MSAHAMLEALNPIVWTNGTVTIRYREANNDDFRRAQELRDEAEQLDLVRAFSGFTIEGDPEGAVRELVEAAAGMFVEHSRPAKDRSGRLRAALARFGTDGDT